MRKENSVSSNKVIVELIVSDRHCHPNWSKLITFVLVFCQDFVTTELRSMPWSSGVHHVDRDLLVNCKGNLGRLQEENERET